MDMGRTVFGVIGLTVAVILVAVLAIPVLDEASKDRSIQVNDGSYFYSGGEFEMVKSDSSFTVDSQVLTYPTATAQLAFSDVFAVTHYPSTSSTIMVYVEDGALVKKTLADSWSLSMNASGSWTLTEGETTVTGDAGKSVKHLSTQADADYVYFRSSNSEATVFVNMGSDIIAVSATDYFLAVAETSNPAVETFDGKMYNASGETDIDVNMVAVDQGNGSYSISSVQIVSSTNTYDANLYVPIEYYVLVDGTSTSALIFGIIPVLLIVGVVMMAVRMLGGRD